MTTPFDVFTSRLLVDIDKLSRTVQTGEIDVSAAVEKATIYSSQSGPDTHARDRVVAAIDRLSASSSDHSSERALLHCNADIVASPGADSSLLRGFNSTTLPYLPAADVPDAFLEIVRFCDIAARRPLDGEHAKAVVTRLHWMINVHGHIFADGCSRTAVVFAAFIAWRNCGLYCVLPDRTSYLHAARAPAFDDFAESFIPLLRVRLIE